MDSLLANYGSSDEEEDMQQQPQPVQKQHQETSFPSRKSSAFPSLPPPNSSSSLFFSLPPPKSEFSSQPQTLASFSSQALNNKHDEEEEEKEQQQQRTEDASKSSKQASSAVIFSGPGNSSSLSVSLPQLKSSSIFSSLPPPKTSSSDLQAPTDLSSSSLNTTKRIVQFKLPINPSLIKSGDHEDEDEDDDNDNERKESKISGEFTQTSSVKSFLSSIPAPKNSATLGALPSSLGSGRKSIVEADVPKEKYDSVRVENEVSTDPNVQNYEAQWVDGSSSTSFGTADGSSEYAVGGDSSNLVSANENYVNYGDYGGHGAYGNYGQYESNWVDGSDTNSASGMAEHVMRVPGKRGRNEIPQEIFEVRQDELMKNRPREDQARLTGIAFGPSYQPVSTKGKPTKLHKRKHQIGSLYYDMKQKEMELAERRAKGFLTKAETQAKYGW